MENQLALVSDRNLPGTMMSPDVVPHARMRGVHPIMNIATISSGFEKGDFLVREEKGQRVYFDFFEEAFNYIVSAVI